MTNPFEDPMTPERLDRIEKRVPGIGVDIRDLVNQVRNLRETVKAQDSEIVNLQLEVLDLHKEAENLDKCNENLLHSLNKKNEIVDLQTDVITDRRLRDLNQYSNEAHDANATWWYDTATNGKRLKRNKGELLMLIVSEIAEAMEGERKDLMDDHLPHRKMAEVELADALIRIFDYAGAHNYDLEGAYREKMAYNAQRADHKLEARQAEHGKKF